MLRRRIPEGEKAEPAGMDSLVTDLPPQRADLAAPAGSVIRICGLRSTPQLNGTLGQVLRAADTLKRTIVQTFEGEKAFKAANISAAISAVCPKWTQLLLLVLALCTIVVALGLAQSEGRNTVCSTATPLLAAAWVFWMLSPLLVLYRSCRPAGTWVPSLSSLANRSPSRLLFLVGMLAAGLALATTTWLFAELLAPQILDGPMALPEAAAAQADPVSSEAEQDVVDTASVVAKQDSKVESMASANDSENTTVNGTAALVKKPDRISPASTIESSVFYGYVGAAALAAQALCCYEGLSPKTLVHVLASVIFSCAIFEHCSMSTALLTSAWGAPHMESLGTFEFVIKARQTLADFATLVLMAAPLTMQMFKQTGRLAHQRTMTSMMSILDASGLLLSLRSLQWGAMVMYTI